MPDAPGEQSLDSVNLLLKVVQTSLGSVSLCLDGRGAAPNPV